MATWSAPGLKMPVLVSPVKLMLGNAALPKAIAPASNFAVFKFVKLVSTSAWVNGEPLPARVTIVVMG
jgi:hypothetical protein